MQPLSIVIIGAPYRRAVIKQQLKDVPDVAIAGEINTPDALRLVHYVAPDVVILDCDTPAINPLVTLPALLAGPDAPQVIALAASDSLTERRLLLEYGALAVARLEQPDSLVDALHLTERVMVISDNSIFSLSRLLPRPRRERQPAIAWPHERAA